MKILYYLLLSVALCFVSCNDDDENLSPTGETNWFALEDSDDELGHLAYEIYKETGVTIFYNDTIAKVQDGVNPAGEPIYRYEVLGVNYNVTGHYYYKYPLLTNREQIKKGMEFIRDEVIPGLLNGASPVSFLLVDSLIHTKNKITYLRDVFKARKTTCVALYEKRETEIDEKDLSATILAGEFAAYMSRMNSDKLTNFYSFSVGKVNDKLDQSLYGVPMSATNIKNDWNPDWRKFGFLSYDKEYVFKENAQYQCPQRIQDVSDYVKEVLLGDDAAFEEKNGEFKLCMEKYNLMKSIVAELKETLGKRLKQ